MSNNSSGGLSDWKSKYLNNLDEQERLERQHTYMLGLLVKGLLHISQIAEGIDPQLDKQLSGLRQLLKGEGLSRRNLTTLVDALAGQIKRLDIIKTERAKALTIAFKTLVTQLNQLKPPKHTANKLKQLSKQLKTPQTVMQQSSALLNEYAEIQQKLLETPHIQRVSKPFWHQWANTKAQPKDNKPIKSDDSQTVLLQELKQIEDNKKNFDLASEELDLLLEPEDNTIEKTTQASIDGQLLEADDQQQELIDHSESIGEEPAFSRLNQAICSVLNDLLAQIDPPDTAKKNYQAAKKLINKGLNWYELVSALEEISIVVVSAFDRHYQDFEGYLTELNQRLEQTFGLIQNTDKLQKDSASAGEQLHRTMHEQLGAMQQQVTEATELEQLKLEVNLRLENIGSVMNQHSFGEQQRNSSLSKQLDALLTQVKVMEADAKQAKEEIEEQRQKALHDALTQLPNREAYQQRLQHESERWQRYQRPLSMAVCDIDHFKRINDGYGHLAGDKVLRIIAKTLMMRLRKTDFIARYGGEEFVILLPETQPDTACNVLEGLREAIATCPFHFNDEPVSITLSFGVSAFIEDDTGQSVFSRCDKALYQAKEEGRNKIVLATLN